MSLPCYISRSSASPVRPAFLEKLDIKMKADFSKNIPCLTLTLKATYGPVLTQREKHL